MRSWNVTELTEEALSGVFEKDAECSPFLLPTLFTSVHIFTWRFALTMAVRSIHALANMDWALHDALSRGRALVFNWTRMVRLPVPDTVRSILCATFGMTAGLLIMSLYMSFPASLISRVRWFIGTHVPMRVHIWWWCVSRRHYVCGTVVDQ